MELQAFEKYFKLPLYVVPDSGVFIFSQPNEKKNLVIAFNWLIKVDNFRKQKLLDKINGKITEKFQSSYIKEGSKIFVVTKDNKKFPLMLARGWGMLTGNGAGGFGLNPDEAEKIQDQLIDYILEKLNE